MTPRIHDSPTGLPPVRILPPSPLERVGPTATWLVCAPEGRTFRPLFGAASASAGAAWVQHAANLGRSLVTLPRSAVFWSIEA